MRTSAQIAPKYAYFHGGSNVDRTGKFTHAVVAWNTVKGSFEHMTKCPSAELAAKCHAEFVEAFGDEPELVVGIYPYEDERK